MSARFVMSRLAAFGAVVALVGGCAVTRIDVDVYKGPLANHEHVQMQQMAVMAIGAKPLLIHLRDKLEAVTRSTDLKWLREQRWHKDDRFIPPKPDGKNELQDENAVRVNAILSLYEDRASEELKPLVEQAKDALGGYGLWKRRFSGSSQQELNDFWARVTKGMNPMSFSLKNDGRCNLQDPKQQRKAFKVTGGHTNVNDLREAYEVYLTKEQFKHPDDIAIIHCNLWEVIKNSGSIKAMAKTRYPLDIYGSHKNGTVTLMNLGANSVFKALSDRSVVELHAELLFRPDATEEKEMFINQVTLVGDSFLKARDELRRLFRTVLTGLVVSDGSAFSLGPQGQKAKRGAVALVAEKLVDARHICAVVNLSNKNARVPSSVKSWVKESGLTAICGQYTKEKARKVGQTLAEELYRKTSAVATALLEADVFFAQDETLQQVTPLGPEDVEKEKRRFGLTKGPVEGEEHLAPEELGETFADFAEGARAGLGRGRLDEGLETLVENYLNSSHTSIRDDDGRTKLEQRRLVDALVGFAEKILFVANNHSLIRDRYRTKKTSDSSTNTDNESLDRYVLVLQAVGNSILIQADELQHRASHRRGLEDAKDREARALAANPHKVLENLVQELKARAVAVRERLAELNKQLAEAERNVNSQQQNRNSAKMALDQAQIDLKNEEAALRTLIGDVAPWDQAETILEEATLKDKRGGTRPFATILKEDVFAKFGETPKKATEVRDAVVSAIKGELAKETRAHRPNVTARARALEQAQDKIAKLSPAEVNKIADAKAETIFPQLREIFDHYITKRRLDIDAKHLTISDKQQTVREKNDALIAAETALNTAEAKKRALLVEKAQLEKESETRLANTVEMIEAHRQEALAGFNPAKDDVTPSAVILLVRTVLRRAQALLATTDPKWQKYRDALDVLDETAMSATATASLAGGSKTSKDALDQLIAALRHEHVQAVRLYGEDSATAKNAKAALAAAYEHRSGMVYIRPSSAYLRSSYPATSLQGDPRLGWENMLSAHNLRSIPLVGAALVNAGEKENLKIQSEIDKQFWQNINSVRVAGAGRTNYVMAKDDIGNWYVKKYSSDPKDIIESTKNLALFGMGSKLNTNLIRRAREQEQQAAGQPVTPQRPPLGRVLDQEAENYDTRTKSHYDALRSTLAEGGIARTIRTAWEAMAETSAFGTDKKSSLLGQIEPAHGEALKPVHDDLAANADKKDGRANRILSGLDALFRFHKALKEKIAALDLTKTAADKLKSDEKAKSDAESRLQEANKKLLQAQSDLLKAQKDLDALSAEADKNEATKKRDEAQGKVTAADQEVQKEKTAVAAAAKAVDAAKATLEKAKNAESFVLTELTRIVRGEILKVAGQRVNAVEKLEAATMFIGNATKAQ